MPITALSGQVHALRRGTRRMTMTLPFLSYSVILKRGPLGAG